MSSHSHGNRNRMVVHSGWGERGMGNYCLMGTVLVSQDEKGYV